MNIFNFKCSDIKFKHADDCTPFRRSTSERFIFNWQRHPARKKKTAVDKSRRSTTKPTAKQPKTICWTVSSHVFLGVTLASFTLLLLAPGTLEPRQGKSNNPGPFSLFQTGFVPYAAQKIGGSSVLV